MESKYFEKFKIFEKASVQKTLTNFVSCDIVILRLRNLLKNKLKKQRLF